MAEQPTPQGSTGLDPKIAGLLAYLFGWLGGLIIFLIEKDNKTVRFHGLQSVVLFISFGIIWFVLIFLVSIMSVVSEVLGLLFGFLIPIVGLGFFILWIVLMVKAYNLEMYKVPIIGNIVEKYI